MKTVSTVLIATGAAPKTWCSIRVQMVWKIRLDVPDKKKATYAALLRENPPMVARGGCLEDTIRLAPAVGPVGGGV